jgi:hypothetical protein
MFNLHLYDKHTNFLKINIFNNWFPYRSNATYVLMETSLDHAR